jgi:hypothetical protein
MKLTRKHLADRIFELEAVIDSLMHERDGLVAFYEAHMPIVQPSIENQDTKPITNTYNGSDVVFI